MHVFCEYALKVVFGFFWLFLDKVNRRIQDFFRGCSRTSSSGCVL